MKANRKQRRSWKTATKGKRADEGGCSSGNSHNSNATPDHPGRGTRNNGNGESGRLRSPDLVVVGLQEIIELSATNVMVDSAWDVGAKDAAKLWVANLEAALAVLGVQLAKEAQEAQQNAWLGAYSYKIVVRVIRFCFIYYLYIIIY